MTLSDSHAGRRLSAPLRPQTSPNTGLPQLPGSPFKRAVPNTPDGPEEVHLSFASLPLGPSPYLRRVDFTFGAGSGFTPLRPVRLLNRPRRRLSRGFDPASYPTEPLVSYQVLPTTSWVDPASTGEPRRWGTLRFPGSSPQNSDSRPKSLAMNRKVCVAASRSLNR
jgi:hypothetical protein